MSGQDLIVHASALPASPPPADHLDDLAASLSAAAKAEATRRAYATDWADFSSWCAGEGAGPLPAASRTLIRYFTHQVEIGRAVATIDRRAAAIACAHRTMGFDAPTAREEVRQVLIGIRNTLGRRPEKKQALTADLVAMVIRKIKPDLVGLRDRALILLCFGAALRRSELVGLDVDDLDFQRRGLVVRLGKTKTDQAGQGRSIAIPDGKLKIPESVKAWLEAAAVVDGPIFRGCEHGVVAATRLCDGQFARVLKARCARAGLDPALISGHSPRRGFATTAGDVGADLRLTANHMRHVKLETTMGYMEEGELFRNNAGKGFL